MQFNLSGKVTWYNYRKGSGIAGNLKCVGVGQLVGGVHCWLVHTTCVSVLNDGKTLVTV